MKNIFKIISGTMNWGVWGKNLSEILMTESKSLMDFNSWKRDLIQGNRLNVLWKDEFFGMTSA